MIRNPGKKALKAADIRETPRSLFDSLNQEFRFTLDAAATEANALCPRYFTEETDGLVQTWAGARVWCNPPFTELMAWTTKAHSELNAPLIVMLVPANRTDQPWWQKNVVPYIGQESFAIRWLDHRTKFTVDGGKPVLNAKGREGSPSFACALLVWS